MNISNKLGYIATATVLFCLTGLPLQAQNQFNLNELEAGQLILNLNSNEQINVEQDTLNVMISYTAQSRNASDLQDEVNKAVRDAREILQKTDNIEYTIQGYRVYMVPQDRNTRNNVDNPVWRAQQNISMQSLNSEALLVVTARLQQLGLTVDNMSYSLSDEKHQEVSDALLKSTLENLQSQAEAVAATLGKDSANLVEVNVNVGQNFSRSLANTSRMSMAMADEMSVPVAEPGESQVSVNVSARALLSE